MSSRVTRFLLCLLFLTETTMGQHYPENIHLAYGDDISIMHVTWATRKDPLDPVVIYGLVEEGRAEKREGKDKKEEEIQEAEKAKEAEKSSDEQLRRNKTSIAITTSFVPGIFPNTRQYVHKAVLADLLPGREYWYRCGSPSQLSWSVENRFKTMPAGTNWSPRLAIYGDLGATNHRILHRLVDDVKKDTVDAVLHAGDIAYDLHSEEGRVGDMFMQEIEPVASRVPYMVAPGNHEAFRNFVNYKMRFFMPGGHENMMYSFRMGPMLVIAVSTEAYYILESGGRDAVNRQYKWLSSVLKEANLNRREVPWIIVFGHRPMYCSNRVLRGCSTGNTRVRDGNRPVRGKGLETILYDHGVDAIFWGHQHSYERMFPVYKKKVLNGSTTDPYDNPRAPVHFIAGCAGSNEARHNFLANPPDWSAFRTTSYGYIRLTAANDTHMHIEYLTHVIEGPVLDEIWIRKDTHGPYQFLFPQNQSKTDEEAPDIVTGTEDSKTTEAETTKTTGTEANKTTEAETIATMGTEGNKTMETQGNKTTDSR